MGATAKPAAGSTLNPQPSFSNLSPSVYAANPKNYTAPKPTVVGKSASFDFAGGGGEQIIDFAGYKISYSELLVTVFIGFLVFMIYRKKMK